MGMPDLFTLNDNGKNIWVLIVNINPGGPNGGSATQYFLGDFDGKAFTSFKNETKWLDFGPDEYAGVTWNNTENRRIFLGWMNNWLYGTAVPTERSRSAMTIPRELKLEHAGDDMFVASEPVEELNKIEGKRVSYKALRINKSFEIVKEEKEIKFPCRINLSLEKSPAFSLVLSNDLNDKVIIGYDKKQNQYFIDRTQSGNVNFQKDFAAKHFAPRLSVKKRLILHSLLMLAQWNYLQIMAYLL